MIEWSAGADGAEHAEILGDSYRARVLPLRDFAEVWAAEQLVDGVWTRVASGWGDTPEAARIAADTFARHWKAQEAVAWTAGEGGHPEALIDGKPYRVVGRTYRGETSWEPQFKWHGSWERVASDFPSEEAAKADAFAFAKSLVHKRALNRRDSSPGKMSSPWGSVQGMTYYGEGVVSVSTAGHGGFKLDAERNRQVPTALRAKGGWYEEDCEWARVAVAFPSLFTPREREMADRTLRGYDPDAWEAHHGRELQPGESRAKDDRLFMAAHALDFLAISASRSSEHPGMVEVTASIGGARGDGVERRTFLVPSAEYEARRSPAFLIDPAVHEEMHDAAAPGMR